MLAKLSKLIIQRIIADVGAEPNSFPPGRGLLEKNLLLNDTLPVAYEDSNEEHDVFAGQITLSNESNLTLKGLLVDLTIGDNYEYLLIFRLSNLTIYAAKIFYPEPDLGETFLRYYDDERKTWVEASLAQKANILAQFETIVSYGFLWNELDEIDPLLDAVKSILNNGEA